MIKRIKFGQWSLLVHLDNGLVNIDYVWHPKDNINLELKVMSFGSYDSNRVFNLFKNDLHVKYSDINNESSKNKELTFECGNTNINYKIVQNMIERTIDYINFNWTVTVDFLNGNDIYIAGSNLEYNLTDDITITYIYTNKNVPKLNENKDDAYIYLNICSNTFGCIYDNPTLKLNIDKFIEQKLLDHVSEMQMNLVNAICAVKAIRGELIK